MKRRFSPPVRCYVTGASLHFAIMSHKKKILAICPTTDSHKAFNELTRIEDSCNLLMDLIAFGTMARVIPYDPNDPAAK